MIPHIPFRRVVPIVLLSLVVSGCSSTTTEAGSDAGAEAGRDAGSPLPEPAGVGVPHEFIDHAEGLTDQMPSFPPEATPRGTVLTQTVRGGGTQFDFLHRRRNAEVYDSDDVEGVLQYYRDTLPQEGWTIEEVLGGRITFDGYGAHGTVQVAQEESSVSISVAVFLQRMEQADVTNLDIPVPDWFVGSTPEVPEGAIRREIEIAEGYTDERSGTTVQTSLSDNYVVEGTSEAEEFASTVEHLRGTVPDAGWTYHDEREHRDERELPDGTVHTTDHWELHYRGNDVYLSVNVSSSHLTGLDGVEIRIAFVYTAGPPDTPPAGAAGQP